MKRIWSLLLVTAWAGTALAQMPIKQSTATTPLVFLMVDSTDHITGKTGLSPTVTISKNGGTFASPSGAVTEIANGWYKVAGNATDTNTTGALALHAAASGADPVDLLVGYVGYNDPTDVTSIQTGLYTLRKNVASQVWPISLFNQGNGNPLTGATGKSCQISKDFGSFAATSDSTHTEIGNGWYQNNLSQAETNANVILLYCTATSARPYLSFIYPQH